MTRWFVEIVEYDTERVDKSMRCHSERDAEKVDRGANINLNHERFYTRIRQEPATPTPETTP